jgi:sister-chromatid-cohesion protein PDS5
LPPDRDSEDPADPVQNLYRLAEIAQVLIQNRAKHQGWVLSSYPGKVKFPKDIFQNLHDPLEAQIVSASA